MNLNVEPDKLRAHSISVATQTESLAEAVEAAAYLANVNDGYGLLCRAFAEMLLTGKHEDTATELRRTFDGMTPLSKALEKCADEFDRVDTERSGTMGKQQERVAAVDTDPNKQTGTTFRQGDK
ncbi:type VII secretion target [Nocardia sp. NPDC127579]|uniref:type VII secretion target n=1 Tax=Nocardia sp. NPDC127579 TaxID=3345402 RepID=UPI0036288174